MEYLRVYNSYVVCVCVYVRLCVSLCTDDEAYSPFVMSVTRNTQKRKRKKNSHLLPFSFAMLTVRYDAMRRSRPLSIRFLSAFHNS